VQIAARYELWNSVVAVQSWWHALNRRNATIRQETMKNCHSKLLPTISVKAARNSGRQSTSPFEKNVSLVRDTFTCRPRKSTRQADRECGLSRHTVHSDEQKSIGLKFSKSRTGIHVTYSCHHNSIRFTCPIFVYSWRFFVFHSSQPFTPLTY